ncbi:hypothetical protein GIB67_000607 [Kingdonia uniflora]|uniref:Uncharacterized protein n=1 Tax=Kingdonia uniflora TaxID=39325 RepID=A0A7J7P773_9MAGN|nr:hypothetical protein GIB67_000607 [Kingdonia uniflora]
MITYKQYCSLIICLAADYDLTGQLVWPGATLMNNYLSKNLDMLQGCSIIELGSGIGVTGILCSRFSSEVVLTDHNEEVLKASSKVPISFQQCSIRPLFNTVDQLLRIRGKNNCKFILAYVSRAKMMDTIVTTEAIQHGMKVEEIPGTRSVVGNGEGVIFEITLR